MKSREIIHEFVNMARHPEAKDLAEALNEEKSHKDCLIQLDCDKSIMTMEIFLLKWQHHQSKWGACELLPHKILGRPITAFDVCWALQKTHTDLMIRFNGGNSIMVGRMLGGKFDCWFWLEAKNTDGDIFLTEWGDEVCDKITDEFI